MTNKEKQKTRLEVWQGRFERALCAYSGELERMDARERMYRGSGEIEPMFDSETSSTTPLVRNVIAENIESSIDTTIPSPKVSAVREEDAPLAKMIEQMLYSELDRLPTEQINDLDERMCPIHGASFILVEWDSTADGGDVVLTQLGARMVIPQEGVSSSIDDMEYFFLRIPRTKGALVRRYGVDLSDQTERYPEIRGAQSSACEDMVTQIYAYYRNDRGGVGVFSWVGDTVLDDEEEYSAPRERICVECGAPFDSCTEQGQGSDGIHCPVCGSERWRLAAAEFDYVSAPSDDGSGTAPVMVESYCPTLFPLVVRRNISVFGSFLGESDVDKMATQQNVLNRLSEKMLKKCFGGGTVISLPDDADITLEQTDGGELRIVRPRDAASASLIRTFTLEGDISQDMALYAEAYEEARQITGITDSLQGRRDTTATSAVAKQFAASQSQGRFESKRVMKKAAWARIYELIFKLKLAYSRGACPLRVKGSGADAEYGSFDRMAFLCTDQTGQRYFNDRFMFSCDDDTPLESDRAAMWSEAALNLSRGAYGDPSSTEALMLFWRVLQTFHYPGAGVVLEHLEKKAAETQSSSLLPPIPPIPRQSGSGDSFTI